MVGSPESIYRPEWGIANDSMLDTPKACQDLVDHVAPPGGDGVTVATEVRTGSKTAEEISIVGRRWMIGRGLRLVVMKCDESLELRQAFVNVVSSGIAKGMSEGLRHGVEHGQAQLNLESIEAYDPEAKAKYIAA
nr:hypothetical protein [Tanacetum cinerariifolium]